MRYYRGNTYGNQGEYRMRRTKAQAEFRKQMRTLEKEGKTKGEGFTSYIERGHIQGYYSRKYKHKILRGGAIAAIGFVIIRGIFFTSYGIGLYNQFASMMNLPAVSRNALQDFNDKKGFIIDDIGRLNGQLEVVTAYNDYLIDDLGNLDLNVIKANLQALQTMELGDYGSEVVALEANSQAMLDKAIEMHELILHNIMTDRIIDQLNGMYSDYSLLYDKGSELVLTILENNDVYYEVEGNMINMYAD